MRKHFLVGCSLLVLTTLGSIPAQAQNPSPAPSPVPSPAPSSQQQVNPDELKKFANALKKILVIANDAESQMGQVIQKEGLTPARFNEIYQAKKNPTAKPVSQITPKEEQSYQQAVSQLTKIQESAQTKRDQAIEAEGLKVARFEQILTIAQKSPELRQEIRKMIQTN
jgi:hypothetical protein